MSTFKAHTDQIISVAFSPDSCSVLTGAVDSSVKVFEVSTGSCMLKLEIPGLDLMHANFSFDGSCIVTCCFDGVANVWDTASGKCLKDWVSPKNLMSAFLPDISRWIDSNPEAICEAERQ